MTLSDTQIAAGWKPVEAETDPGVGFYRFRNRDLPETVGSPGAGGTSTAIELFAISLEAARAQIGQLVHKRTPVMRRGDAPPVITASPVAHRKTNLSKRQRREIAEAEAKRAD